MEMQINVDHDNLSQSKNAMCTKRDAPCHRILILGLVAINCASHSIFILLRSGCTFRNEEKKVPLKTYNLGWKNGSNLPT